MKRNEWLKSFWVKSTAFIITLLLVPAILLNAISLIFGYENSWWTDQPHEAYETSIVQRQIFLEMDVVRNYYSHVGEAIKDDDYFTNPKRTNYRFRIYDQNNNLVVDTISTDGIAINISNSLIDGSGRIESGIAKNLAAHDGIFWTLKALEMLFKMNKAALPLLITCILLFIFFVIYFARTAGRKAGSDEVVTGWQEKIPLDLYIVVVAIGLILLLLIAGERGYSDITRDLPLYIVLYLVLILIAAALLLSLWITFCTRVKLGKWWKNTVTFWMLATGWRILKQCYCILKAAGKAILTLIKGIPLVWKTVLLVLGISFTELFGLVNFSHNVENLLVLWFMEKIIIVPLILWGILQLKKLQAAGITLANGDLESTVDTHHMYGDFKRHGENLNQISKGMQLAVEKQLKSERLKTELITNVSHDIKTPLTSIINYVDLLKKDPNGMHTDEYLEVLDRQSKRLKKLTEDLVEVSKASTGNLTTNPIRCNLKEVLANALAEHSDKLESAGLETVLTLPEQDLFVWADGNLLWRVLDNLISNACKYGLSGTRFYVDAANEDDRILISFKNISRDKLNIDADELMERFVRGDTSRSGEGSGLGLNIAKSLVELQHGTLTLTIVGDLFKVDILLPSIK